MDEADFELIKKGFQYLGATMTAVLAEQKRTNDLLERILEEQRRRGPMIAEP